MDTKFKKLFCALFLHSSAGGCGWDYGRTMSNRTQSTFFIFITSFLWRFCWVYGVCYSYASVEQLMDHGIWSTMVVMNSYSKNTTGTSVAGMCQPK